MWTLSRTAKARIVRRLNPRFLLVWTLGLGAVMIGCSLVDLVRLLLGYATWNLPAYALVAPMLAVHTLRFALLRRGWAPVCAHDLKASNLEMLFGPPARSSASHDEDDASTLEPGACWPMAIQAQLAQQVQARGWLAWSDVFALFPRPKEEERQWPTWMAAGGWGSRIARRSDWEKALHPSAWHGGALARDLPVVDLAASARPRF